MHCIFPRPHAVSPLPGKYEKQIKTHREEAYSITKYLYFFPIYVFAISSIFDTRLTYSLSHTQLIHSQLTVTQQSLKQTHSKSYLLIQGFMMFEEGLKGFENLNLTRDACWWLSLSLHHCHPQTTLMARHQALQMLQQELDIQKTVLQTIQSWSPSISRTARKTLLQEITVLLHVTLSKCFGFHGQKLLQQTVTHSSPCWNI